MTSLPIALNLIDPPAYPLRVDIDESQLATLATSIITAGQLQPILVKRVGARFEVIFGHRRYLAHKLNHASTIDCVIEEHPDAEHATGAQMVENFERADLSPMEEARALRNALDAVNGDTQKLADLIHRRHAWVNQRLTLLDLPDDLSPLVHTRALAVACATALARCSNDQHRADLTKYAIDSGASAAVISQWVQSWRFSVESDPDRPPPLPVAAPPGQRVIVQLPCPVCNHPTDYTTMQLTRICKPCFATITRDDT